MLFENFFYTLPKEIQVKLLQLFAEAMRQGSGNELRNTMCTYSVEQARELLAANGLDMETLT